MRPTGPAARAQRPAELSISTIRRRDPSVGVPRLIMSPALVRELPIDSRVAFVMSHIDGRSSLETLLDVTGFDRAEVLSILARLVRLGAIATGPAR
ncbi:MAG: hypothetical protein ACRENE_11065 [Polyangiaceae bacterium]